MGVLQALSGCLRIIDNKTPSSPTADDINPRGIMVYIYIYIYSIFGGVVQALDHQVLFQLHSPSFPGLLGKLR